MYNHTVRITKDFAVWRYPKRGRPHENPQYISMIYFNGMIVYNDSHRIDKPSNIVNGREFYFFRNNRLHRDGDKPALISQARNKQEYWRDGDCYKIELL